MVGVDLHGQYKTFTADRGLLTADCGLHTTDYGLGIKHRFLYNITQYMYKREQTLSYARALRSIHLFVPLLKGDQFHAI